MKIKVGVVQESPVFFDKAATLKKIASIVANNAKQGCQLLVFPESYIPGYPRGFDFGATIGSRTAEGKALYATYHKNSVALEGDDMDFLIALSKKHQTYLVMGITEKQAANGSLYCSMVYISPADGLLGVHRKIKPTGTERLVWAEDDGASLVTFETHIGRLGGLICWENYMPLARMAIYQQGVQIYLAPTADSREEWTATMKHIALEGRCFVLGCNQYFTKSMYPEEYRALAKGEPEDMCPGGSVIVSPHGKIIAGPLFGEAGVLLAELDLEEIAQAKMDFDVNGHYNRPDIFDFKVNKQPKTKKEKDLQRMNLQPTLENDLVLLRPLRVTDFEALYQVAKDPKIWELHQNPDRWELTVFKEFFKGAMDSMGAFVVIDKGTNNVIGSSRFKISEDDANAVEIGWTFLAREYWGGTYNKSFKSLMIDHAFHYVDHIIFHVDQNNFRSQKAVRKLGGTLIDKQGELKHLHTKVATGLTFVLQKTQLA